MSEHIAKTDKYSLDSFYGGQHRGRMLAMNVFDFDNAHIELTKPEVLRLIGYLMDWVNRT